MYLGTNGLKSIADIFERRIFRIPDYQRGFSWQKDQLSDFWEDVVNLSPGRSHYTGLLTLEKVKEPIYNKWLEDKWLIEKGYKPYFIVDGQQRLTTIVILLMVISEKLKNDERINYTSKKEIKEKYISQEKYEGVAHTYIFGYEKDNPSYEFLKTKIFNEKSSSNQDIDTLYTVNLERAKRFFKGNIKDFNHVSLESLYKKITLFLKFNVYEIEEEFDVFVAFETMNNRGLGLSKLELMKNRLIYLSTLFENGQNEKELLRMNINNVWKTIYEYLGKNKNKPLDDDDFLKNHWILYFQYTRREANVYAKFLLDNHFTLKKVLSKSLSLRAIQDYIFSLQECVKTWYYIQNPNDSDYSEETKKWLIKLDNLGYRAFSPLIMAILIQKVFYNGHDISQALKKMEKYLFLIFNVSRRPSNTGDSEFYRLAKEVYSNKLHLNDVIEIIDKRIKRHYDINRFKDHIAELFTWNEGYYSWNGLKYFLFEYDYSLQEVSKEEQLKIDWVEFNKTKRGYISIEHIYPQASELNCWKIFFEKYTDEEKNRFIHSIGNLVPLSHKKNASLQNDCFKDKKHQKKGKVGYFNGSYSENEVAQNKDWTPESILKRGMKLLSFMEHRWDISLGNEDEKITLLHLSFLRNR